jgi:hypothetical protein
MINRFALFTATLCAAVLSGRPNLQAQNSKVKHIVLEIAGSSDSESSYGV